MTDESNLQEILLMIRDITYYYVKHYYNKLTSETNRMLTSDEIKQFIDSMYEKKSDDLKIYIQNTLHENLQEQYPEQTVNTLLTEMFKDVDYAKMRLHNEIIMYQQYGDA